MNSKSVGQCQTVHDIVQVVRKSSILISYNGGNSVFEKSDY